MTRAEEIQKLIDEETGIDNYGSSDYQIGVCDGVRLADKTMLDKACEWLANNTYYYCTEDKILTNDFEDVEEMIAEFRQAMEGE